MMPDFGSFQEFFKKSLRAVFFDFDGVIIDSESGHYEAFTEMLRGAGILIDDLEYQQEYVGHELEWNINRALELHKKELSQERVRFLMGEKADHFNKLMPGLDVFVGVREFFDIVYARNIPVAVVSSSLRKEVEAALKHLGLLNKVVCVVAADDLRSGERKPSPVPYERGLKLVCEKNNVKILPEECLVIEDSGGGVKSGKAAGMKVLAVTNSFPKEKLFDAGADWVVESLIISVAARESQI